MGIQRCHYYLDNNYTYTVSSKRIVCDQRLPHRIQEILSHLFESSDDTTLTFATEEGAGKTVKRKGFPSCKTADDITHEYGKLYFR